MRLDEGAGYSRAGFVMVVSHNAGSWTSIIWMNGQCSSLLSQLPSPHIKRLLVFYFTEFNSFDYFSPPCSHLILFSFAQLTFWVNLFSFFFFLVFMFPFLLSHHTCGGIFILSIFCKTFTYLCFNFLFPLAC